MTKMIKLSGLTLAISAALTLSAGAQAYQAGDMVMRAGFATVSPNTDSGKLKADGAAVTPATTVDVDSNTQLGLTFTYMLTDHVGLELLAATPFKHTIKVKGGLASLGKLADVEHLPPTLSVQYFPMDSSSVLQPYVGAGLNYTTFFDESFKGDNKTKFRSLELEDSWGIAFQAGVDYMLTDNLGLNAAVWWIDIDTEATFKSADGATKYKVDVELDPWVYMVGMNYKF
ncbi:outer membrane beta-barrel protein [Sansalvadorimonas sp. 2012CJ34-2]|uniref:Outer membrane beta-barrel protein n=1 Tax=Parendozoicomonas callyspongiae TaxID=2942213 RepID=A0ABT0PDW7_9GAMM|nr:OmpW family outer membrane protein [Sansalvadorimonas sp. 2012CJ34-2]MCL6269567.1 outer membrane beta-barrel protein [Sansalvadorimonas sp. 2012CJ34-2]